jgi:PEP-CTERM motif
MTTLTQTLGAVAAGLALSSAVHTALFDRGNGIIYDSTLNVTWLQNANLALTETFGLQGIDTSTGKMFQPLADDYIAAMNAANYKGYSNWMLPQFLPASARLNPGVNPTAQSSWALFSGADFYTGARDVSYNISDSRHQLGNLFYSTLGNQAAVAVNGTRRDGAGKVAGVDYGLKNVGVNGVSFTNLALGNNYWTDARFLVNGTEDVMGLFFGMRTGYSANVFDDSGMLVWAVRAGDVAAVPEPTTLALLLGGLAGLGVAGRRKSP